MMNGVNERVELDAVGKISPNTSFVGEDLEAFFTPPNTKDVRGKARANQNHKGTLSREFGVSHVGRGGCGVCGSTFHRIMSKLRHCDGPNGAIIFCMPDSVLIEILECPVS